MKIVEIIEYKGDNDNLVWKHSSEDFNTMSQLIVRESQEALLFLNGQALDLFGPGRHTLSTQNIPILGKILNIPTGGVTPFKCEVYFINRVEQMAINWGMGNVNFLDPTSNDYAFVIGASGEMSLSIVDSVKIMMKLVGLEKSLDCETLKGYFKAPITMHIKTMLPNILREKGISIFEVETRLSELSQLLKDEISKELIDYGVALEKFWINTILKPEQDPVYITLNKQRGEKVTLVNQGQLDMQRAEYNKQVGIISYSEEQQKQMMNVDTQRYEQEQLKFTYQQKEGFEVLKSMAKNEGSGSDLRNAAMGIGMGFGVGGAFGDVVGDIARNTMVPNVKSEVVDEKRDSATEYSEFENKVKKLMMAKEVGLISEEEFVQQKTRLLEEL